MNFLYCLDAGTGNLITSFGESGHIDLRKGLAIDGVKTDFSALSIALTTPGVIYKDMIIVGGREPEAHPAPPGTSRLLICAAGRSAGSSIPFRFPASPAMKHGRRMPTRPPAQRTNGREW